MSLLDPFQIMNGIIFMKNKILFLDFDGVLHPDRYSLSNHDPDRVFKNNEILFFIMKR